MKDIFMVKYKISDRGIDYPEKEEEIIVKKDELVYSSLIKRLKKYRYAMDLSTKFTVKLINSYHNGYCK